MSVELPHYTQEEDNTCALACLRMVLAAYGAHVPESELKAQAKMVPTGTPIEELERLARRYGLVAEIQHATVEHLRQFLAAGKLPVAFIDRAIFKLSPAERRHHSIRQAIQHNVIPVTIMERSVTLHDPLEPRIRRRTLRLFRQAFEALGGVAVVCSAPEQAEQ
jgi:ABC-type bacteriocin/lantibiotic exporter with double-glycine peptidase domain